MTTTDWIIIAIYLVSMLAIGLYCAQRTKDSEDYLLGGRRMSPSAVGLSLFASIFSTISYLSLPGEVIRNGPAIAATVLAYPFVAWIAGWFLIPSIMKLKVTSAYEILELRFGLGIRLLGSCIFLLLRLFWMAMMIHVTTSAVLAPMLGLSSSSSLWASLGIGALTVIYSSMGGLRAVVITDVIQTAILSVGAVLTLVTISRATGGLGDWFSGSWTGHWPRLDPGFGFESRISVGWMVVSTLVWYICTTGSDQMAVQRYSATRDARSARRVLITSLSADCFIILLQVLLGVALLAYFRQHSQMIPTGQSILTSADRLFPRYIMFGLSEGVSGLIMAGLLSAAMSSLSSGITSCCSVVLSDFVIRLSAAKRCAPASVRVARWLSALIGVVVLGLSLLVRLVPGNLLEVGYRIANPLVTVLFIPFLMAMFVPWATTFGTWIATISTFIVAFTIAYWELLTDSQGPSFLLIMPASLAVGVGVGLLASLLPVGTKSRLVPSDPRLSH